MFMDPIVPWIQAVIVIYLARGTRYIFDHIQLIYWITS